jgi:MFS family permease
MTSQVLMGIHRWFAGPQKAKALGWNAVTLSGGAALGQVLGGSVVSADVMGLGWRAVFLLNLPICALVLLLGLVLLPRESPAPARVSGARSDTR